MAVVVPRRCCAIVVPLVMARLDRPDPARRPAPRGRPGPALDLYGRARQDSLLDALTGLGNHRAFQEELSRQLEHATRHRSPLALLLVDVDDLKKVNDEQRPRARATSCSSGLGRIAMNAIRRGDRAFRVGGDEFAVILPNADIETGLVGRAADARERAQRRLRGRRRGRAVLALDRHLRLSRRRARRATCSTGTPTPPCTGASATAGRTRSPTTRGATASRRTSAPSRTCRRRSGRSSPRSRSARSTSRSSR